MRLVKGMLVVLAVALTVSAQAKAQSFNGFQGPYAPGNFTLTLTNSNGSVDSTGAPGSITITGSDNAPGPSPGITNFNIAAVANGTISFDFDYLTTDVDGPFFDPFSFTINGVPTQLSNSGGPDAQSGSASFLVNAGDVIGFQILATDDQLGSASVTISNFVATPEPATMAIFGLMGLVGAGAALRRRNKAAV